ncbi:unnamed protein product [Caenorhabditis auriculariae]|uniref:PPM-type phosphatase domain-containing protein n=1 Tax=Caenorhabditis auriculariae TaxID=2777116 RepID=A0A8S1H2A7_9PELO|nr:unnamed protein product [Caenorhabditis auriculariae]
MEDGFADQYPACCNSGIGSAYGGRYSKSKKFNANHELLDSSVHIDINDIQLYAIFCGFNGGSNAAKFSMNRMVYEIFQDQPIKTIMMSREIIAELHRKFANVARRYMDMMTDSLSERFILKDQNDEVNANAISELDQKIREGCTAIVALRIECDLFVLNCGTSMAIAITDDPSDPVVRINDQLHENENPVEIERLKNIGVDPENVLKPTRAIGDLHRIIAVPDIYHVVIQNNWRYIVLISDGVVQNLKEFQVEDVAMEVYERLKEDHTATSTAQSLVDAFARKHLDAYTRNMVENGFTFSNQREEMTVIFVKLEHDNLYETFKSSTNSTLDYTQSTTDGGPVQPYVDVLPKSNKPDIQKFLLDTTKLFLDKSL